MKTRSWCLIFFSFIVFNAFSSFVLFSPEWRKKAQSKTRSQQRTMLSVVEGDLLNEGSLIKVVKFKSLEGIVLEFYSEPAEGGWSKQISRVILPNAVDGFLNHHGRPVQLAVSDLDGDGTMELLAPAFDSQMIAQLNPYKYSHEQKGFVPFFFRSKSY